jgi:hypothetical protein
VQCCVLRCAPADGPSTPSRQVRVFSPRLGDAAGGGARVGTLPLSPELQRYMAVR